MTEFSWTWGEESKRSLESLLESAKRADSEVNQHLKSVAMDLVKTRLKAIQLHGGVTGQLIDLVRMNFSSEKTQKPPVDRRATITEPRIQIKAQEIMNSIPSMNTKLLHKLLEDLMNKKPLLELDTGKEPWVSIPIDF